MRISTKRLALCCQLGLDSRYATPTRARSKAGRLSAELTNIPDGGDTLDNGSGRLVISDTGQGLPAGLDVTRTESLGLRLVNLLVRQLRGQLELNGGPGATFSVPFPLELRQSALEGALA